MTDLIIPITKVPHHVEVRADQVILRNCLDAAGAPGTPGKYQVVIDVMHEVQTESGEMISRTRGTTVVFDPMDHQATEIPGTGMTAGQIMGAFLAAVDNFKGGIPTP
jgi:hypothetical protein